MLIKKFMFVNKSNRKYEISMDSIKAICSTGLSSGRQISKKILLILLIKFMTSNLIISMNMIYSLLSLWVLPEKHSKMLSMSISKICFKEI